MITAAEMVVDWCQARESLQRQLDRLTAEKAFPRFLLTKQERSAIADRLERLIADYDSLISASIQTSCPKDDPIMRPGRYV